MDVDSVALFIERAVAVRPDFEITSDNAATIIELVNRLDGLPLAIELVASRLRHLPVSSILERLDARMLNSGSVDLPERQRTIDGAIAWSYELLDVPARTLFARMSVFVGGGRLEEIETVCGPMEDLGVDVFEGLGALLDQALVRRIDTADAPRFQMLHVIREYAMTRLQASGEAPTTHRRFLEAYTEVIEGIAPRFLGTDRKRWLDFAEAEHDNVRAALEWAQENGEVDLARRLAAASWRFWQARGHLHEARRRVEAALALPGGELEFRARAMEALGGIYWWQAKMMECLQVYEEALAIQRELGDPKGIANALYNFGLVQAFTAGRENEGVTVAETEEAFEEAERLYRELGDLGGLGDVEWGRGSSVAFVANKPEEAIEHMKRAIDYYSQAGNDFGMGWGLFEVGIMSFRLDRHQEAWDYLRRGLSLFRGHGDVSAAVLFLASIAAVAQAFGDMLRTARLTGAFTSLQMTSGTDIVDYETNQLTGLRPEELEAMSEEMALAFREGRGMDLDTAIAYALAGPTDEAVGQRDQ